MKQIDFAFYHEKEIRTAVKEMKRDEANRHSAGGGLISDPTSSIALRHLTPVKRVEVSNYTINLPERWLAAIDATYSTFNGLILAAAVLKYTRHTIHEITSRLNISVKTYYKFISIFRDTAKKIFEKMVNNSIKM